MCLEEGAFHENSGVTSTYPRNRQRGASGPHVANWAPDGCSLLFMADLGTGQAIWRVRTDGTGLHAVFTPQDGTGLDDGPAFTPDGRHIVFTRCCPAISGNASVENHRRRAPPQAGHLRSGPAQRRRSLGQPASGLPRRRLRPARPKVTASPSGSCTPMAPSIGSAPGYGVVVSATDGDEEVLTGGNASARVVRVGETVRKPWLPTTERTIAYLRALRDRGLDVPAPRGRDEEGRLVLDYVPGELAMDRGPLDAALLHRVGALVRTLHDASVDLAVPDDWEVLIPADRPDLLCHNDLATWNLVVDGERLVFIDWDGAGPSTRSWDLAYAAVSFGQLFADQDPRDAAGRLAAFVDGYGADGDLRTALPTTLARRARAVADLLRRSYEFGREPWGSMYVEGHGRHWDDTATYVARHETVWSRALS